MTTATADTLAPELRINRLDETVRALIALLHKETAAVKASDLNTFTQLQPIKSDLYDVYQTEIQALLSHKDQLKTLPSTTKERIRGFEEKLATACTESLSALERASKSFMRLRDRIMNVARETALRAGAQYGSNGELRMRTNRVISTGHQDRV